MMKVVSTIQYLMLLSCFFAACTPSEKTTVAKTATQQKNIRLPDSLAAKQASGIDFSAQGEQPLHWTLDMDVDKAFYFRTANGISLDMQPAKPFRSNDPGGNKYTANTPQGDITIMLYDATCSDGSANKKVEVTLNSTRYSGCGNDLYNSSVNDTWILEKIGSLDISGKDFSGGAPKIKIDIAKNLLTGNDGCGNISMPIEMKGSRISFAAISGSKQNCKNAVVQKIFAEKLANHVADYYFKDGKLYLYLIDDSVLIFKRS